MDEIKAYLDHLYFSLFSVFAGLIGLYIILYILDFVLRPAGMSFGVADFSLFDNFWLLFFFWLGASCILAAVLTVRAIRTKPKDQVVFTKRKQL